ncbi:MAG: zinc ribbon domain-containing protein, partial [Methanomassiliicoccales archaeon]
MDGNKVCPYCGRQAPSDAQWCAGCGKNIAMPPEPQQGGYQQPPPPGYGPQPGYQQPPPGYGPAPGTAGYGPRAQVQSSVQMRAESDEILGTWWAFLPLIAAALTILGSILGMVNPTLGFIVVIGLSLVSAILYLLLFYKLLSRQNKHFKREMGERSAIAAWFKERATELGRLQFIGPQLGAMESINQESQFKEKEHSIILIILLIIPLVNFIIMLYLLYIFSKYPFEHDQRWHHFTQNAQMAGQQMGVNIMMPSWKTLP